MNPTLRPVRAVLAATIWIGLSEFVRNQFLLQAEWTDHYRQLGLEFPSSPVNGALWGLWSLLFAIVIFFLSERFSIMGAGLLAWTIGFVLMWVVIGNLGVLPLDILPYAIPLSLLEAFGAAWIVKKVTGRTAASPTP